MFIIPYGILQNKLSNVNFSRTITLLVESIKDNDNRFDALI